MEEGGSDRQVRVAHDRPGGSLPLTMVQTSGWITGPEMTKMEPGSLLGVEGNQRPLAHL